MKTNGLPANLDASTTCFAPTEPVSKGTRITIGGEVYLVTDVAASSTLTVRRHRWYDFIWQPVRYRLILLRSWLKTHL